MHCTIDYSEPCSNLEWLRLVDTLIFHYHNFLRGETTPHHVPSTGIGCSSSADKWWVALCGPDIFPLCLPPTVSRPDKVFIGTTRRWFWGGLLQLVECVFVQPMWEKLQILRILCRIHLGQEQQQVVQLMLNGVIRFAEELCSLRIWGDWGGSRKKGTGFLQVCNRGV